MYKKKKEKNNKNKNKKRKHNTTPKAKQTNKQKIEFVADSLSTVN
jgi:hypothetical protein